jgi:hypothetical protein
VLCGCSRFCLCAFLTVALGMSVGGASAYASSVWWVDVWVAPVGVAVGFVNHLRCSRSTGGFFCLQRPREAGRPVEANAPVAVLKESLKNFMVRGMLKLGKRRKRLLKMVETVFDYVWWGTRG